MKSDEGQESNKISCTSSLRLPYRDAFKDKISAAQFLRLEFEIKVLFTRSIPSGQGTCVPRLCLLASDGCWLPPHLLCLTLPGIVLPGCLCPMSLFLQGRQVIGLGATLIQDDLILTSIGICGHPTST